MTSSHVMLPMILARSSPSPGPSFSSSSISAKLGSFWVPSDFEKGLDVIFAGAGDPAVKGLFAAPAASLAAKGFLVPAEGAGAPAKGFLEPGAAAAPGVANGLLLPAGGETNGLLGAPPAVGGVTVGLEVNGLLPPEAPEAPPKGFLAADDGCAKGLFLGTAACESGLSEGGFMGLGAAKGSLGLGAKELLGLAANLLAGAAGVSVEESVSPAAAMRHEFSMPRRKRIQPMVRESVPNHARTGCTTGCWTGRSICWWWPYAAWGSAASTSTSLAGRVWALRRRLLLGRRALAVDQGAVAVGCAAAMGRAVAEAAQLLLERCCAEAPHTPSVIALATTNPTTAALHVWVWVLGAPPATRPSSVE
mmetsp:Transcript_52824/g.86774  ORF Transcript_52824/g.86774 Transcript_52824/m.86774 type:complete len:363 (+) Transcript_52824:1338-2426(+)